MPWIDTLGLAGETALEVAEAGVTAAAFPFEAAAVGGAAALGGLTIGAYEIYDKMVKRKRAPVKRAPYKKPRYNPKSRGGGYGPSRPVNCRRGGYIGREKKYSDQVLNAGELGRVLSTSVEDPSTNHLCAIAQGSGNTERDGLRATIDSIHIKGKLYWVETNPGAVQKIMPFVRLMVIHDKQTNGAQLSATEVLQNVSADDNDSSFRNLEYTSRFKVMKDVRIRPPAVGGSSSASVPQIIPFEMHFTNLCIPVRYKGTGNTVADVMDNSFHLIAFKAYNGSTDNCSNVQMRYNVRCRFYPN